MSAANDPNLLSRVWQLTEQMLSLAEQGDFDALVPLETERSEMLKLTFEQPGSTVIDAGQEATIAGLIALNNRIVNAVSDARQRLLAERQRQTRRGAVASAYQAQAAPSQHPASAA